MTKARKTIININDTPYYHCMGKTVRGTFLLGVDRLTGKDYSHRRQWIVDKLSELSHVYCVNVCAYAVMSNHYHLVLKINQEEALSLSDNEVIDRWMQLFNGNVLIQRYLKGECKSEGELSKVIETIALWRERLMDISWFMRCFNESIAHMANKEDKCTGRFWNGRFKSQALLNEQALLSCMAYVDLNPIRAGLAESLEGSEFTGIEQRIRESNVECLILNVELEEKKQEKEEVKSVKLADFVGSKEIKDNGKCLILNDELVNQEQSQKNKNKEEVKPIKLADFVGSKDVDGIPYLLMDYLELVDWTGRAILDDKKGFIPDTEPKIISKLGFTLDVWMNSVSQFSDHFYSHIGSDDQLKAVCNKTELNWLAGSKSCRSIYKN